MTSLFEPVALGGLALANRIVMSPLTRARTANGDVPTELNAQYYAQRAGFGLIVTEATNISPHTCSFERAPGLWTAEQIAGWKLVTQAVHVAHGHIFAQLWHCGRAGAKGILGGQEPWSPSAVNDDLHLLGVWALLANGNYVAIHATPSRAMTATDIATVLDEYRVAAANAIASGFDGVEIHAANGYLPHQFLSSGLNLRTDVYGGSVAKRARFLHEVVESVAQVVPRARIGVRISPFATYNNPRDSDPESTYAYVADMLDKQHIGYLHFVDEAGWFGKPDRQRILEILRPRFHGPLIANGGLEPETAKELVTSGQVQMVAFGRYAIANPDLVHRIQTGAPLVQPVPTRFYAGGAEGYTDYPALAGGNPRRSPV
jgi:N-ethylmaleimide reductase